MADSGVVSPSRGCRAILSVAGRNGHSVARTGFVSGSITDRVAIQRRCRFEVRLFAVVYRRRFRYRRREKGRIKTRRYSREGLTWTMMVAGPPSTIHQSAHGKPNAVRRSARGRCNLSLTMRGAVKLGHERDVVAQVAPKDAVV